jgi:transcriptional regulator with XRE-family HTH domain
MKKKGTNLGKRILRLRLERKKTQREVSELTGLAVSYLSRLENGRITPSIPTLTKIAEALAVEITAFFDREPPLASHEHCPVSTSGHCVLDQLLVGRGRRPKNEWEGYTPDQLEVLRLCDYLIHNGEKDVVASLSTMLESLLMLTASRKGPGRKTLDTAIRQAWKKQRGSLGTYSRK